jgi:tetratricopeptide (TPR) repeat protein
LGVGGVNAFKGAGTRNIEAYEAYLHGRASRGDEAIRFYKRATQLDPNYSAAWSMLGLGTLGLHWTSSPEEADEIRERAFSYVLRAVELDPESAQATSLLGTMHFASKDWIRGEAAHLRALSLLSDRHNLSQYGNCLMRAGRSADALEQWQKAEAVEPALGLRSFRVYVALAQGRFADAREVMARAASPRRMIEYRLSIALNERDSEEIKATIAAMPPTAISTTALYSPVLSVFDSPEMVLSTLRATYADKGSRWPSKLNDIALLAAYFGDPELSLQIMREEMRNSVVRLHTVWYPIMSEVRELTGFKELVTDLNLVAYWRASGWADLCQPLGDDDFECT